MFARFQADRTCPPDWRASGRVRAKVPDTERPDTSDCYPVERSETTTCAAASWNGGGRRPDRTVHAEHVHVFFVVV